MKTIVVLPLILVLVLLHSCSPVQKLNRLQNRHPYLFENIKDTVIHTDTISVKIPQIEIDTFVLYEQLSDTVYVEKDGLKAQLWKHADTVFIRAKTDTVTVKVPYRVEIPVTKYKVVAPPTRLPFFLFVVGMFLCFLLVKKFLK